jgi:OOP family OmpA-OmpF porin
MRTIRQRSGSRIAIVTAAGLALAACGQQADAPPSDAEPTVSPEPVSIIRDDVDVPRPETPLSPLETSISFGDNGAELGTEAEAKIDELLASPQMEAGGQIVIGGHSDSSGTDDANLRVSQRRADAVRDYLVENGVAEGRITVIAFGEQNPVKPNANPDGTPNEAGRAANRRVEITVGVPEGTPRADSEPRTLVEQLAAPDE